ncbi:MAG: PcfJ domain-containing protein [Burkholderiales bacterium]|nr:PcfJ domain-containing protein [Burkholderiales bacterium]
MTAAFMRPLPTPIGDGLTELTTSIQFDPVMLAPPDPSPHDPLGLPPQPLRAVHWPALIQECVLRIRAVLAHPIRLHRAGAARRIGVLDTIIYERQPDGQYRLYEWRPGEVLPDPDGGHQVGMPWLRRVPDGKVVADGAPYQALWLTCYAEGLRQALELQWPEHPLIDDYVDWVQLRLEQALWTQSTQQRVRALLAQALDLDTRIVRRARRWLPHQDGSPIRLADYNLTLWRRQQGPRLRSESPQWLPLLAQLWRHLPTEGEPVANLRALLLSHGVSPAMWRLLHREGTAWIWPLRNYYTKDSQHSGRAALELVLKAQKFGTRQLVPLWMLQALMNLDGNPNLPRKSYLKNPEDPIDAPMAARLGQWAADRVLSGDEQALQQLHDRCYLLLNWAAAHPRYVTSRALRQVTLTGLWRKAEQWHQQELARARHLKPWRAPFELTALQHDELALVWLGSAADILDEACAMRHCADSYVERCARGSYVLLSVRRKDTGKRLATVGLQWADGRLQLHQMTGFANALVPPPIAAFAQQAVASMKINQPEPIMHKSSKSRTYVHLTAVWGNDDAESTIKVSRRRWQQIQDGEPYCATAWSWYEGTRTRTTWSFGDGELTISQDDGFECYLTIRQLYVNEVTSAARPKK